MWNQIKNRSRRSAEERRLRRSIADSILAQNKFKVGNLNDYANLANRVGDKEANAFSDWADSTFTEEDKAITFDVVVTTKDDADENADYVYNSDSGFAANFYKV